MSITRTSVKPLFGFPVYHSRINKNKYDKKKILKPILDNFKKSELRDTWSADGFHNSKMHHSHSDNYNDEFEKPDYSSLIPIYKKEIEKYFKSMHTKPFKFEFKIVNYTCMTEGHYMASHIHTNCDFSAVHYLKFKDEPTVFRNTNDYSKFSSTIYPKIGKTFLADSMDNSWAFEYYKINTKEDDLVIFPAMLEHAVPEIKSGGTRVTIVFNIRIV